MIKVLREESVSKGAKTFTIVVTFDGESYSACGYVDGFLINETSQYANEFERELEPYSPEIENLIFLIRDDIFDHEY
ncbi:MAG: hypothetical protein LWX07_09915 [Bacteroidetes bacterium]|nr:hypothetical protein [Bacteroidota bacterium]